MSFCLLVAAVIAGLIGFSGAVGEPTGFVKILSLLFFAGFVVGHVNQNTTKKRKV